MGPIVTMQLAQRGQIPALGENAEFLGREGVVGPPVCVPDSLDAMAIPDPRNPLGVQLVS